MNLLRVYDDSPAGSWFDFDTLPPAAFSSDGARAVIIDDGGVTTLCRLYRDFAEGTTLDTYDAERVEAFLA